VAVLLFEGVELMDFAGPGGAVQLGGLREGLKVRELFAREIHGGTAIYDRCPARRSL
jgi:hypothetical protein